MVAFKEEFPYLKAETGQLFEFDRGWLREAITRAANDAGYPSWWLTEHVTESIAFYLRLRNDESFIAFNQLSQTVRYVLKVIGYKEIVPHFSPTPPPVTSGADPALSFADSRAVRQGPLHSQFDTRLPMRRTLMLVTPLAALAALVAFRSAPSQACDPDNGGLTLPAGFCATVYAQVTGVRHLSVAPNGDVFASGSPAVHVSTPGLTEQSAGSSVGVDIDADDAVALMAEAVGAVLGDLPLAERLRTAGLDRARAFTWRDTAEKVWQLHADL